MVTASGVSAAGIATRVIAAAGLAYDAYAHFDLAGLYDANTAVISQGMLFRAEAIAAVLAGILVLIIRGRAVAAFAALVAGSGLAAVLIYRYIQVGSFGPFPDMSEPVWFPEKLLSAIAEALALLASGLLAFSRNDNGRMALIRKR
ncbi:MAG TPA: hypothetical protein VFO16_03700 [Pseudonocardiaceae bacterium]|nr:hypothetical protein [Pseudonocardiaceae bacterium]